jgi:hypothetical protein
LQLEDQEEVVEVAHYLKGAEACVCQHGCHAEVTGLLEHLLMAAVQVAAVQQHVLRLTAILLSGWCSPWGQAAAAV